MEASEQQGVLVVCNMDMCLLYSLLTLSILVRLTTEEVGASAMRVDVTLASGIDKKQDYFELQ